MRRRNNFYNQHDFDRCFREEFPYKKDFVKDRHCHDRHCKHPPCLKISYGTRENSVGIEIDGKHCKLNLCLEKDRFCDKQIDDCKKDCKGK